MTGTRRNSLLCPRCRKLVSREETACPHCGLSNPSRQRILRLVNMLSAGQIDTVTVILYLNVFFFLLALILDRSSLVLTVNPFTLLSPSHESLFYLGASGSIPLFGHDRWSSLVAASFLHGSLLHILFNMIALRHLGPFVQREYGAIRFLIIYILAGGIGFFVSSVAGIQLTIGASASVCGLIGAVICYGRSRRDYYGHLIQRQAMGWVIGLVIIGLVAPGINNWAHGGGLAAGLALAWLLGHEDPGSRNNALLIIGWLCAVITLLILIRAFVSAIGVLFGAY